MRLSMIEWVWYGDERNERKKRNQEIYFSNNTCVSCGKTIPEGQMVCKCCMQKEENR